MENLKIRTVEEVMTIFPKENYRVDFEILQIEGNRYRSITSGCTCVSNGC